MNERVWMEQSVINLGPGVAIPGDTTFHHEWWEPVVIDGRSGHIQRYEQISQEQFTEILTRLRARDRG